MAGIPPIPEIPPRPAHFTDDAWLEVLTAVDRTYADLVGYQERLERQNAELQEMRTFLTSILASVSDVLIVADRSGRIEQTSHSLTALTRKSQTALIGQTVEELFEADSRNKFASTLARIRERRRTEALEVAIQTEEGTEPLDLSIAPRLDDRGRSDGFVLTGRPLGALRKAYADLSESHSALMTAQAQLVRNEKLASLGRLLAGVAHELNNPISFVYANTHALERYLGKFETYFARVEEGASREDLVELRRTLRLSREITNLREAITGARDGAERVRDIVEDLRRLSSDGAGEMVAFDLAETTRIASHWVMRGMKNSVTLDDSGLQTARVLGRPGHIQQVVMNLVQNSIDAMSDLTSSHLVLSIQKEKGHAMLSVSDNGPGIPSEIRAAIFDPFFTTKPVGSGTGLGLSISHKIAEEHKGALTLRDGTGGIGATFCLELPLAEEPK